MKGTILWTLLKSRICRSPFATGAQTEGAVKQWEICWDDFGFVPLRNEKKTQKPIRGWRVLGANTVLPLTAIEAMKNAHREELERELEKSQRSQISSVNADIEALRRQYL